MQMLFFFFCSLSSSGLFLTRMWKVDKRNGKVILWKILPYLGSGILITYILLSRE